MLERRALVPPNVFELVLDRARKLFFRHKWPILAGVFGLILLAGGAYLVKGKPLSGSTQIQIISEEENKQELIVEVAGEVEIPGVYKFPSESRVEDALIKAGGLSADADRDWVDKFLNRAAKLSDGDKIFIPRLDGKQGVLGTQSQGATKKEGFVNINTATLSELETLWGIGPVLAQKVVDQRPYSKTEELLVRKVIGNKVYEKIKDQITVY